MPKRIILKYDKVIQNVDREFVQLLNRVKAERLVSQGIEMSIGQLTKEIATNPDFKKIIENMKNKNKEAVSNMRLDKKRLWGY